MIIPSQQALPFSTQKSAQVYHHQIYNFSHFYIITMHNPFETKGAAHYTEAGLPTAQPKPHLEFHNNGDLTTTVTEVPTKESNLDFKNNGDLTTTVTETSALERSSSGESASAFVGSASGTKEAKDKDKAGKALGVTEKAAVGVLAGLAVVL